MVNICEFAGKIAEQIVKINCSQAVNTIKSKEYIVALGDLQCYIVWKISELDYLLSCLFRYDTAFKLSKV